MNPRIVFHVPGRPVPQGSKTAFVNKSTGKPVVVDKDVRLPRWRMTVTAHAMAAVTEPQAFPRGTAVGIKVDFVFARPSYHYGTGRNIGRLKPNAPTYVASMPDLDKLLRAIFDGITDAQVWADDGQVVWCQTTKVWAMPGQSEGALITIGAMTT